MTAMKDAEKPTDNLCVIAAEYHVDHDSGNASHLDHIYFVVDNAYCKSFTVLLISYLKQAGLNDSTVISAPFDSSFGWSDAAHQNAVFLDLDQIETVKEAMGYIKAQVEKSGMPDWQKAIFSR